MSLLPPLLLLLLSLAGYYLTHRPSLQLTTHLHNKVVLVTGASSGIGEELVYQLAGLGARLVITARSEEKLKAVARSALQRGSPAVETVVLDMSEVGKCRSVVRTAVHKMGTIDHMILNHGAMPYQPFLSSAKHQEPEFLEKIIRINLLSMVQLSVAGIPELERNHGSIFVTSSLFGEIPGYLTGVYAMSKHGMNGFFYSLQQELLAKNSNVSVTVGNLGFIKTKNLWEVNQRESLFVPDLAFADLDHTVLQIIGSLVSKPRTLNVPALPNYLTRLMWYFNPYFHDIMVWWAGGYEFQLEKCGSYDRIKQDIGFQKDY